MKTLKDFDFKKKRVLVRCDFNVPLSEKGDILDDFRIKKTIPTIKYLLQKDAKIILMSHLGRPEGKVVDELRLDPVARTLSQLLNKPIKKLNDCLGREVKETIEKIQPGEIVLLENIQFHPGEKKNDPAFAKTLASYADIFIMEAFGQAHRNYASIASIQKYLPSGAGFLLEKEIKILTALMKTPKKPLIVIIGGEKIEDKAGVIDKFLMNADFVLIGGLIQQGIDEKGVKFKYPQKIVVPTDSIDTFDIGPETIKLFKEKIVSAKTVFWSGPLGMIEKEEFSKGTEEIAKIIIESGAFSVAGGGETVEFINKIGLTEKFGHVSTGGGAMLEFLAGEKLPGIEALKQ